MAAAYLDAEDIVDMSFGFQQGGVVEGTLMAVAGATAGYAVLFCFRKLRDLVTRDKE